MRGFFQILWVCVSISISIRIMTFITENWGQIIEALNKGGFIGSLYPVAGAVGLFCIVAYITQTENLERKTKEGSYEAEEPKEVVLPAKLSLEELLTADGEIPDHLLNERNERV